MIWLPLVGLALLVIYEVWAAITHRAPTESEWIWRLTGDHPSIPFALGLLCGHLFL